MKEELSDWHKLNKSASIEKLSSGADSKVFLVKNHHSVMIAKDYEKLNLHRDFSIELTKEILENYNRDTEKAQKLLEEYPSYKIFINDEVYDLYFKIIPQGGLVIESDDVDDIREPNSFEMSPIVISQSFIKGKNLLQLSDIKDLSQVEKDQELFITNKRSIKEISQWFYDIVEYINSELKVKFTCSNVNAKPFISEKDHKVYVFITDLAASLRKYYNESEQLQPLRDKYNN